MNKITYLIIGILALGIIAFLFANFQKAKNNPKTETELAEVYEHDSEVKKTQTDSLSYTERLNKTKELYPFKKWRENFFKYQMEQYTEENCNTAKNIFDHLIVKLIELGENSNRKAKEKCFELAIKSLNKLNEKEESIIETGEREDLCELIDQISLAAGLNPKEYAEGEGIADLWREW